MKSKNLLIVAGSGRNSGKTSIVCKIIEQLSDLGITAVKISPHFHPPSIGLVSFSGKPGYEVFEETNRDSPKDSSRMLQSGAKKVFYIQTIEKSLSQAFSEVFRSIPTDKPVICESPSLINYIEPGLFIIMISPSGKDLKKIDNLKSYPHIEFTFEEIINDYPIPINFEDGEWKRL